MQAQMTPATAPGIAGLMRGMPQGKPPTPQPQQGAQPQGLNAIDPRTMQALGLQKALQKAEMEAAALRQQHMSQQTPQMSVAEQNLQKLAALEAEKMAPQSAQNQAPIVAGASTNTANNQKAMMDKLMAMASQGGPQGIRNVPGSDNVVPSQGMAGGGIVAFQEGGEAPPTVDQREVQRILRKSPMMRTPEENAILRQAGLKLEQRQMGPEGIIQRAERGLQQVGPAARQYLTEGAQGLSPEDLEQRSDAGAVTEKLYRMLGGQQARPPVQPDTMPAEEQRLLGRFPAPQMPESPQAPQQPPMRMPPNQVRSKVPAVDRGVATALPGPVVQSPGGIMGPQRPTLEQATEQTAMGMMGRSPEDMARGREDRLRELTDPAYKAQREAQQAYIKQLEEQYGKAKPSGLQALAAGLRGFAQTPGGIGYGLMGAGQAASGYTDQQNAQRIRQMELLQGLRQKMLGADVSRAEGMFKAGQDVLPSAMQSQAAGVRAGTDILGERYRAAIAQKQIDDARQLKEMELKNPEWKQKLEYAMNNPQAAALMFPKGDKAALDHLKLQVDLKQSQMQALANDLSADAAQRKKELAAEVATLSRALGELSGVPLSQPRPSAPAVGTVMQGYRFKGGDPSDRKNWEKV